MNYSLPVSASLNWCTCVTGLYDRNRPIWICRCYNSITFIMLWHNVYFSSKSLAQTCKSISCCWWVVLFSNRIPAFLPGWSTGWNIEAITQFIISNWWAQSIRGSKQLCAYMDVSADNRWCYFRSLGHCPLSLKSFSYYQVNFWRTQEFWRMVTILSAHKKSDLLHRFR